MTKLSWTPWHQVVQLRNDLRTGELSLHSFAADLADVMLGRAHKIYQDPQEFFALTYPTFNLRELCRDVILRLAGRSDKAIRPIELTYGGGKTHTLITLYHLVRQPDTLPDLPSVHEFTQHMGMEPPQTSIAFLPFDKLDAEKGMEVRAPTGQIRVLKHPWSLLAYQIAGDAGLQLLHAEEKAEERESAPAEDLMRDLLSLPQKEDRSTLILIDEVLMFARQKIGLDPSWMDRLADFFQYLTQAATKVPRCAIIASLLASDPSKLDSLGKEIINRIYSRFHRQSEESIQPVGKDDVAEVLRRRFFTPESIRNKDVFRSHVVAALKGIRLLDSQSQKEGNQIESRFLNSYPFHPDLTEVFYTKWTNLERFQRTRGILRTFALALRNAEQWDLSPLIGANAFLNEPSKTELSEGARELAVVAATEDYEGKRHDWSAILLGELNKSRVIQDDYPGLKNREIEQAVFSIFLHSQPIGQKALTRDLMLLLGSTQPDKIELEKALVQWTQMSWFLDEEALRGAEKATGQQLPTTWRLGSKPNLRQMHYDACQNRVAPELINHQMISEITKLKPLDAGASAAGAKVHKLPERPSDVKDDGSFHYVVLGPGAACESGKPSSEASRFLTETTGKDRPRVYRNAVVLAVPSKDGLDIARQCIRDYLGWEEVKTQLSNQEIDPLRQQTLDVYLNEAKKRIPEAIRQAYCVVVAVSEKNEIQAFKLTLNDEPLFLQIKQDERSRIQDTAISAEALVPGGPYDLWREEEESRRVKDLVQAFAQFSRLPKMLNSQAILSTLLDGCQEGIFVLRHKRPDGNFRTFWRQQPDADTCKDPSLEVLLPEKATLADLPVEHLLPGALPKLWQDHTLQVKDIYTYFSGTHSVTVRKEGYEEPLFLPKAEQETITQSIHSAVKQGKLWLVSNVASFLCEAIPEGVLTNESTLQLPPQPLSFEEVLPENLPEAWSHETTTVLQIADALAHKIGQTLPWKAVREVIDGSIRAHQLSLASDSALLPDSYIEAHHVKLQKFRKEETAKSSTPEEPRLSKPVTITSPGHHETGAYLYPNEIQNLADEIGDLLKEAAEVELSFFLRMEIKNKPAPSDETIAKLNQILQKISPHLKFDK